VPTTTTRPRRNASGRSTTPRGRTATRRPSMPRRRQAAKPTGLSAIMGALPFGGGTSKSRSSAASGGRGKKGAGIALATAAAGFALSNRDKLTSMLGRGKGEQPPPR
jgi:hypothetical protein